VSSSPLDKAFDPQTIEAKWYPYWESTGLFKPSGKGTPYSIMLPPPNVTGTLHMGHAFQHTLMDALIRYHRMQGRDTLWQMGTDHAGIATEMVVGRNLAAEGLTRDGLGREKFIERVWQWKEESGSTITRQMRRIGASGDWSRERFTMDDGLSDAVLETFVRLHEQGLIYRGKRLVNWDPVLKTAISDLEVDSQDEDGFLWSIRYLLSDGSGELIVATTRPETLLGDVAVAVHPEDERYAELIGKTVRLPLTDREIPIIADAYVDREFGTGCVKITPAHDFNDYEIGKRHQLEPINIFNDDASLNDSVPAAYRGLDRYVARKAVLADLIALGALVEEKKHRLKVPRGDRTGQVIEPYLTDQWFVRMEDLGKRGLEIVESGKVRFVPENWINTYRHWMANIQDWCVSRQLWWGHQIPAWYDTDGQIFVARSLAEAQQQAGPGVVLRRDPDVLETWFSSALWSHSTLGWPNQKQAHGFDRYLPTSVLVTGFDILFFWVARMIMMTDHFTGDVPFKEVYITALVRDKDGQKMSKTKGNILDPLDLIDGISLDDLVAKRTRALMQPKMKENIERATRREFPDGIPAMGADALRFTFASLASYGRDIKFDMNRCEGYKNFCNKLWNAARFVQMNTTDFDLSAARSAPSDLERWIRARLNTCVADVHRHFASYRFDLIAQALYEFTWNEYCDWFLELAKPELQSDDPRRRRQIQYALLDVLEQTLRLLHPLIPFVTEEIWSQIAPKLNRAGPSISIAAVPLWQETGFEHAGAERDVEWLKQVLSGLRQVRSQMNISPAKSIPLIVQGGGELDAQLLTRFAPQISALAKIESIGRIAQDALAPASALAQVGDLKLLIPLAGLIDLGAELNRLEKERTRLHQEIGRCNGKLGNDKFVASAPEAVVAQERQRLNDFSQLVAAVEEQIASLKDVG